MDWSHYEDYFSPLCNKIIPYDPKCIDIDVLVSDLLNQEIRGLPFDEEMFNSKHFDTFKKISKKTIKKDKIKKISENWTDFEFAKKFKTLIEMQG